MRILQIVADGDCGGGTTFVIGLMEDLQSHKNIEISFVTQRSSYALQEAKKRKIASLGLDIFSFRWNFLVVWRLGKAIRKLKPDLIHVHGGRAAFFASLLPKLFCRSPFIYTPHGLHFLNRKGISYHLGKIAERWIMRRADKVVFICHHDKNASLQEKLTKNNAHPVIHNGIDLNRLPQTEKKEEKKIVFLGRLVPQKDPCLAIEVMEKLCDFHLTMVGGGELEGKVREKIEGKKNVTFKGSLPREQALEVLAGGEILLLTSRWEGLPLVVLEAMGMGVLVVAADVCGVGEVIQHGKTGILIKDRSPEAYAEAIRSVYEDRAWREEMILQARLQVKKHFSREAVSGKYLDIYRGMENSSGS